MKSVCGKRGEYRGWIHTYKERRKLGLKMFLIENNSRENLWNKPVIVYIEKVIQHDMHGLRKRCDGNWKITFSVHGIGTRNIGK